MSRRYVLARVLRLLLGEPGPWPVESVRYAVATLGDDWRQSWALAPSWRFPGQLYAAAHERGYLAVVAYHPLHPPELRRVAMELRAWHGVPRSERT